MTRKEEINQAAHKYINSDVVSSGNEHLAFGDFINGAEWADKTMLDKVCEWLGNHNDYQRVNDNWSGVRFDMTQCVFDLRKAMGQ